MNESLVLMDYASVTNTMINVKVNKSDPTDLYEQVAAEIRRAIADGEAKPGERLPPARISPPSSASTRTPCFVLCGVLRDEGLLEFRRGRGISVAGTPERGAVVQRARELVEFARHHGTAWTSSSRSSRTSADDDFSGPRAPEPLARGRATARPSLLRARLAEVR